MGKVQAVLYRFAECECRNVFGGVDAIPAGIYPVAELDVVTVAAGNKRFDLEKNAFNLLKAEGKVTDI